MRNKNKFERNSFIDIAFIFAENNIGSVDFYKAAEQVFINSIYISDHNRLHKMLLSLLMMYNSSQFFQKARDRLIEDTKSHSRISIEMLSKFIWVYSSHYENNKHIDLFNEFEKEIQYKKDSLTLRGEILNIKFRNIYDLVECSPEDQY